MAGNDKTLRETVNEVVGETITHTETGEGISKSQSGETSSGGTPEYVAGVDISDIPEQDRPRIKAKLEAKLALLDKGYQPKYQKVAKLEKSLEWLASKGLTAEKAEAILLKSLEGETKSEKKETIKTLDKLISDAPYEQKEALQNMRKIVLEETNTEETRKEIAELKKTIQYLANKDFGISEQQVETDLSSLEAKFGKDLISKYRDAVKDEHRKYPQSKAKDILKYVVPDEEYEQALLSKGNRKNEKINAVTNNGTGVVSSTATLNVRKTGLRDILTSVIKEKRG